MSKNKASFLGFYRPHERVTLDCGTELVTKQSHKDECDIHNILRQYQRTGIIQHINSKQPIFTDLPSNLDYQDSLNLLLDAQEAFSNLPASVRDEFRNDPAAFLAAFSDPSKADRLRELGLLNPRPSSSNPSGSPTDGATGASQPPPVGG